jgi:hypothetical protein
MQNPSAMALRQVSRKLLEKRLTIFGAASATLFFQPNPSANLPVRSRENRVHRVTSGLSDQANDRTHIFKYPRICGRRDMSGCETTG